MVDLLPLDNAFTAPLIASVIPLPPEHRTASIVVFDSENKNKVKRALKGSVLLERYTEAPKGGDVQALLRLVQIGPGDDSFAVFDSPEVVARKLRASKLEVVTGTPGVGRLRELPAPPDFIFATAALRKELQKAAPAHECSLLANPELLTKAYKRSPSTAFFIGAALADVSLAASPIYREKLQALVASHHPCFGGFALHRLTDHFPEIALDDAHFAHAAQFDRGSVEELQWAGVKVEESKRMPGALSRALAVWGTHATYDEFDGGIGRMLRDEKRPLVIEGVWAALAAYLGSHDKPFLSQSGYERTDLLDQFFKQKAPKNPGVKQALAVWLKQTKRGLDTKRREKFFAKVGEPVLGQKK